MNRRPSSLLTVLSVLSSFSSLAAAELKVWTVAETRHVLRDEAPGTNRAVQLAAARNEWEGFQILVRSDEAVKGANVVPGDLQGPGGAVLRADDALLYRQHQLELTAGTYRNDAFKPGWYPDPLIPFRHPVTRGPLADARFVAVPFDLPAGQTHGFWVDLYVPPEAAAGEYRGVYRVTSEGGKAVEIPVSLTVWGFVLPRVATLQTEFGSPEGSLRRYYRDLAKKAQKEPKEDRPKAGLPPQAVNWDTVNTQVAEMLTQHHINCTPPSGCLTPVEQPDGTWRIPAEEVAKLRDFVDRYQANALQVPHPSRAVKDPDEESEKLGAWLRAFDRAAKELGRPNIVFYTYLKDEPNDEPAYRYVRKWGKAVRTAHSVVKVLVVEQTKTQDPKWGDLNGAIDIWCPLFSLHDPETAGQRQAFGETVWTYTALCQLDKTPWWHIDYPLLDYRVPTWIAWRCRMKGLLYWGGLSHWSDAEDPWTDPKTYRAGKGPKAPLFNGEGTLAYPARPAGYDGIAASLRMKALRDSIEDFEYLAILDRAKLTAEADAIVRPLAESWFKWDPDPAAYQAARAKLAALILAKAK